MATRLTKAHDLERIFRDYQERTGQAEVNMDDLAAYCEEQGWVMPTPPTPRKLLVRELSKAIRQATRTDKVSGNPYRAYHCVEERHGQLLLSFWRDIDEAPRPFMDRSLRARSDQVTNDLVQLSFDAEHWNRVNPQEEPLLVNTDLTLPVQIRKNAPKMIDGAG